MTTLELSNNVIEDKWRRIQARLRAELGEDVFTSWFGRMELESFSDGSVQVSVPTKFLRNWLQSHYAERLLKCCQAELEVADSVEFRVRQPHDAAMAERRRLEEPTKAVAAKSELSQQIESSTRDGRTGWDGF